MSFFHTPDKYELAPPCALRSELFKATTVYLIARSDDGYLDSVVHAFLHDIARESRGQIEKLFAQLSIQEDDPVHSPREEVCDVARLLNALFGCSQIHDRMSNDVALTTLRAAL